MSEEQFVAAMVLGGVGDAMGYKNGDWEFNFVGENIHKEVKELGGVSKLKIKLPNFMVSDDTVLLLSTADSFITVGNKKLTENSSYYLALYKEFCFRYHKDVLNDMSGRSAGLGTMSAIHKLSVHADKYGWHVPFNNRGGGCGAAMRAMAIGLRYPVIDDVECFEHLVRTSVESGRMTHNHPTGFLGSFATAFFGACAVSRIPMHKWGSLLVKSLPCVERYIEKVGRDVVEIKSNWSYFEEQWTKYLANRKMTNGDETPSFPAEYGVKERDVFYKSLSFSGWGGASGHDAPMIAYDALLASGNDWEKLCLHGMLHGGDNDSSGVIAGFCYGAMYGMDSVPSNNHSKVEKRDRLVKCGKDLFQLATPYLEQVQSKKHDDFDFGFEEMLTKCFDEKSFIYP